jgi:hypothetical protein
MTPNKVMVSTKLTKEALNILRLLKIELDVKTTSMVVKELAKIRDEMMR